MSFRFQRRLNFGSGIGLNLSKSGASPSLRSRYGSIGAKGFSIRTGIPGLSFRQSYGKSGAGAAIGLAFMMIVAAINLTVFFITLGFSLFVFSIKVLWILLAVIVNLVMWTILTIYDLINHLKNKRQEEPHQEVVPAQKTPVDEVEV